MAALDDEADSDTVASLTWLGVPGDAGEWRSLGFAVDDFAVGSVAIEPGRPVLEWGFDELTSDPAPMRVPTRTAPPAVRASHPNGVIGVDHVVYSVPDLEDAISAIRDVLGLSPRRRARPRPGGEEMAFFRSGEAVIEVVKGSLEAVLWGVAFRCPDLDATVNAIRRAGGAASDPRPAVQGGRIATVRTQLPVAVTEPARV